MGPTVDEKVAVLAIDAVSTSFVGLAGLILGEEGWNNDGGFSFGYSFHGQSKIGKTLA